MNGKGDKRRPLAVKVNEFVNNWDSIKWRKDMFTIRKQFKFEMSHALVSSFTKCCQTLHGHSYILELFISSDTLNNDGMIIDFGEVKEALNEYIDSWDHTLVLKEGDARWDTKNCARVKMVPYNPTAEMMALDMHRQIKEMLKIPMATDGDRKWNIKVRLHETATGWAEYEE